MLGMEDIMKKHIKAAIAVVFTAIICIFGGINAFAMGLGTDIWEIDIEYENAPEGTAFVDLLFPKKTDDKYYPDPTTNENDEKHSVCRNVYADYIGRGNSDPIALDDSCGLAVYDDGYTSCMLKRYFVKYNHADKDKCSLEFGVPSNVQNQEVFEYYGRFKVAYCNEKGEVLGVTEPVKVKHVSTTCLYKVKASGNKAEYTVDRDGSVFIQLFVMALIFGVPVVIALVIGLIIYLCVRSKKKDKQSVKR